MRSKKEADRIEVDFEAPVINEQDDDNLADDQETRQLVFDEDRQAEATDTEAADEQPQKPESVMQRVQKFVAEGEDDGPINLSMRSLIGGNLFNTSWFRRRWKLLLLILAFIMIYISNRYRYQQGMIEIDRLHEELEDRRNEALSRSSQLLEMSRPSRIAEQLKATPDSDLQVAACQPYVLKGE